MVQRLSAQHYLPGESRYPLHSNHADLVKFDSLRHTAFQTVVTTISEVIGRQLKCFLFTEDGFVGSHQQADSEHSLIVPLGFSLLSGGGRHGP